jgi:hypothetical protein
MIRVANKSFKKGSRRSSVTPPFVWSQTLLLLLLLLFVFRTKRESKSPGKKRDLPATVPTVLVAAAAHTPLQRCCKAKGHEKKHAGNEERLWTLLTAIAHNERRVSGANREGRGGGERERLTTEKKLDREERRRREEVMNKGAKLFFFFFFFHLRYQQLALVSYSSSAFLSFVISGDVCRRRCC